MQRTKPVLRRRSYDGRGIGQGNVRHGKAIFETFNYFVSTWLFTTRWCGFLEFIGFGLIHLDSVPHTYLAVQNFFFIKISTIVYVKCLTICTSRVDLDLTNKEINLEKQ